MANISEDPLLLDKHTSEEPFTSTKRDRALSSVKVCPHGPGSCLLPPIKSHRTCHRGEELFQRQYCTI